MSDEKKEHELKEIIVGAIHRVAVAQHRLAYPDATIQTIESKLITDIIAYIPNQSAKAMVTNFCQGCLDRQGEVDKLKDELRVVYEVVEELKHKLGVVKDLLKVAKCPNCDGSGGIPIQVGDSSWEQEQCQWCYEKKQIEASEVQK
jgi:hypothetical protein